MTKFSNFIRNLGTAGPDTFQGIYDLGFALRNDIPVYLAKYLRVDATQTFTSPEKLQGRTNLGLGTISTQAASAVAITGGTAAALAITGGTVAGAAISGGTVAGAAITGGTVSGLTTDLAIADGGTAASTAVAGHDNLNVQGADIATATAVDLNLATGPHPDITGTVTVTAVALAAGKQRLTRATGNFQIMVGALLLGNAGSSNIAVKAGDLIIWEGFSGGVVQFWVIPKNGQPLVQGFALGQAYLALSGGNLVLSPESGNLLWIDGVNQTIPAAGVSLAPAGLTIGTAYYIYAYMNAGVMTLDVSATGYTVNSASGIPQKTGDTTRTLVGIWIATAANAWSTSPCAGASWFNPKPKMGSGPVGNTTSTSATFVELATGCRLDFVTFPGRQVRGDVCGSFGHTTTAQNGQLDIGLDGLTQQLANPTNARNSAASASQASFMFASVGLLANVGKHYLTPLVATTSATAQWSGVYVSATIMG